MSSRKPSNSTTAKGIVSDDPGFDPAYEYTGGDRGWAGDVPRVQLSIEKLSALGWSPELESDRAVRLAAQELLTARELLES